MEEEIVTAGCAIESRIRHLFIHDFHTVVQTDNCIKTF